MIGPLFGQTQLDNTFATLGIADNPILPDTRNCLLQQILVAMANRPGGGGGAASFATITGDPYDNTALAAALNAKVSKAGDTMTGALEIDVPAGPGDIWRFQKNNVNKFHYDGTNDWSVFTTTDPAARCPQFVTPNGTLQFQVGGGGRLIANTAAFFDSFIQIIAPGNSSITAPLTLGPSSGILERKNGAAAQIDRVYRTYTDDSNYERAAIQTGSGYVQFAAESAGTGVADMDAWLKPAGNGLTKFGDANDSGPLTPPPNGYFLHKLSDNRTVQVLYFDPNL